MKFSKEFTQQVKKAADKIDEAVALATNLRQTAKAVLSEADQKIDEAVDQTSKLTASMRMIVDDVPGVVFGFASGEPSDYGNITTLLESIFKTGGSEWSKTTDDVKAEPGGSERERFINEILILNTYSGGTLTEDHLNTLSDEELKEILQGLLDRLYKF